MTAAVVLALGVGIYALRLTGMLALAPWLRRPGVEAALRLGPTAVSAAVVALQVFVLGDRLALDARAWGAAAAAVCVWRRQQLVVVLVAAAVVTAVVRATGLAA